MFTFRKYLHSLTVFILKPNKNSNFDWKITHAKKDEFPPQYSSHPACIVLKIFLILAVAIGLNNSKEVICMLRL